MAVPRPLRGLPYAIRRFKITTINSQQSGGGARYSRLLKHTPRTRRVGTDTQPKHDLTRFTKWL
eukprot:1674874-Heterocapsa_arctica.AAC.1